MTPSDIAGLKLWLKADAITGLVDTDPVTTWPDSSGLGNDATQATAAKKPTYQTNELNGKPVVRFDGTDDFLGTLLAWMPLVTVFVGYMNRAGVNGSFIGTNASSGPLLRNQAMFPSDAGSSFALTGTLNANRLLTLAWNYTTDNYKVYLDGILDTTGTVLHSNTTEALEIGTNRSNGEFLNGDIAEVIIYDSILSEVDRNALGGYIESKYGITVAGATFPEGAGITGITDITTIT